MKTILNRSKDPMFNLALEEYVLKVLSEQDDFILLWQNANSVIIGRNQNAYAEVNESYVKEHNVNVVRRITGGGAVYHDLGNLNFSFITTIQDDSLQNYVKFTTPVIKALNKLGVAAEFSGRNDIVVDGKKISGNAQTYFKQKMLHHGTILFDVDMSHIANVLKVKIDKLASKGVTSNRARVTNIRPLLNKEMNIEELRAILLSELVAPNIVSECIYELTEKDLASIYELIDQKYSRWEWNYGYSPASNFIKSNRYEGGGIEFHLIVEEGVIKSVTIYGDYLGTGDARDVANHIAGVKYDIDSIRSRLEEIGVEHYFGKLTVANLIDCLFN